MEQLRAIPHQDLSGEREIVGSLQRFYDEGFSPELRHRLHRVFGEQGLLYDRTFTTGHSGNTVVKTYNLRQHEHSFHLVQGGQDVIKASGCSYRYAHHWCASSRAPQGCSRKLGEDPKQRRVRVLLSPR